MNEKEFEAIKLLLRWSYQFGEILTPHAQTLILLLIKEVIEDWEVRKDEKTT